LQIQGCTFLQKPLKKGNQLQSDFDIASDGDTLFEKGLLRILSALHDILEGDDVGPKDRNGAFVQTAADVHQFAGFPAARPLAAAIALNLEAYQRRKAHIASQIRGSRLFGKSLFEVS